MRMFFFFQAEDGIRDLTVTGVQTCALPILHAGSGAACLHRRPPNDVSRTVCAHRLAARGRSRDAEDADRKSTRLNSSHSQISYAVFCLKKKNEYVALLQRPDRRRPRPIPST